MLLHFTFSILSCPFLYILSVDTTKYFTGGVKGPRALSFSATTKTEWSYKYGDSSYSAPLTLLFLTLILTSSDATWNVAFVFGAGGRGGLVHNFRGYIFAFPFWLCCRAILPLLMLLPDTLSCMASARQQLIWTAFLCPL